MILMGKGTSGTCCEFVLIYKTTRRAARVSSTEPGCSQACVALHYHRCWDYLHFDPAAEVTVVSSIELS